MKLIIHCCATALLLSFGVLTAKAQTAYSMHTLGKGETLSVLSKTYHTTVGDIMRLNGMNAQSQLHVGDKIKIPAGGTVVPQKPPVALATVITPPATPVSTPAKTHVVAAGETLFHISQEFKIPVDKLKVLNNLPDGNVKVGQTLLVSEGAAPKQPAKERTEPDAITAGGYPDAVKRKTTPVSPAPVKDEATVTKGDVPPVKSVTETSPQKAVATTANVVQPATTVASNNDNSNNSSAPVYANNNAPAEGYFTPMYGKDAQGKQQQTKNGASMTFKSASGWADKKYYILMNDAPTGSVVKISNGKNELYAKVLWNLGQMKENDGLSFRISTATAAALGITEQKFDLKVSYYE